MSNLRRKRTLQNLLDALRDLQDDSWTPGELSAEQPLESDDGPNVDERIQSEGAAIFERVEQRVRDLDGGFNHLQTLSLSWARPLACFPPRFGCVNVSSEFYISDTADATGSLAVRVQLRHRYKPPPNVTRSTYHDELDAESFPHEIELMAQDTINFLDRLNEFPEFCDEAVNTSILAFEVDLRYWASCLKEFEGQLRYPGVSRYVHDLTVELSDHLVNISTALVAFTEIGVPVILLDQKRTLKELLNLTIFSTFFGGVTATTIQFSFNANSSALERSVNAFWYCSLLFSIASAVNSLLGIRWKQAMYSSPGHRVPWWVRNWTQRSPLIFVIISVAAFAAGLVLFTWTQQVVWVSTVVTALTAFLALSLLAVWNWFTLERWTFTRHRGNVWLDELLALFGSKLRAGLGLEWIAIILRKRLVHFVLFIGTRLAQLIATCQRTAGRACSSIYSSLIWATHCGAEDESTMLPMHSMRSLRRAAHPNQNSSDRIIGPFTTPSSNDPQAAPRLDSPAVRLRSAVPRVITLRAESRAGLPTEPPSPQPHLAYTMPIQSALPTATTELEPTTSPKARLRSAVRAVIASNIARRPLPAPASSQQRPRRRARTLELPTTGRLEYLAALRQAFLGFRILKNLPGHQALVRHVAFSPSGGALATCSWDRTATIVRVGPGELDGTQRRRVLAHPRGFVGQIIWSPDGKLLLTKLTTGIKVWTEDGVCRKTIERNTTVHSVTWFPNGEELLSIETQEVVHLDLVGGIIDRYPFNRLRLHDVAITPDGNRLLAVATLQKSIDGLTPVKARNEKRIVVYNRHEKAIENQVPVVHDVRDVSISRNGLLSLVSYEHKTPPQVWRIDKVKDEARLTLRHTYMPLLETDFTGPSSFGGKDDQFILCASKAGDIYIWDCESATLLKRILPQANDGDLTCFTWNSAADGFMFATGSHDGAVRIWTAAPLANSSPVTGP